MILLKSFFRKKTTKNYIIIFLLISFILLILSYGKNYYLGIVNKNYENSYIQFKANYSELKKLKKLSNIASIDIGLDADYMGSQIILFEDKNLEKNKIIIEKHFFEQFDSSQLDLNVANLQKTFFVKDIADDPYRMSDAYISSGDYQQLISSSEKVIFRIDLSDWSKHLKTSENIKTKLQIEQNSGVADFIHKNEQIDDEFLILVFNIIMMAFVFIYLFLFFITCYNIILDEKQKNHLYYCLGYTKYQIMGMMCQKVILLIILSVIFPVLLYLVAQFIK